MLVTVEIEKSDVKKRVVLCPTCGDKSLFDPSNVLRPFCSARCINMDLGAWANEEFRIESRPDDIDDTATP